MIFTQWNNNRCEYIISTFIIHITVEQMSNNLTDVLSASPFCDTEFTFFFTFCCRGLHFQPTNRRSHKDHKAVTRHCGIASSIFLNEDHISCTGHHFRVNCSSEPRPLFIHPSSPDLQHVALTAGPGHRGGGDLRSRPRTKGPHIRPVLSDPGVYRFLSLLPALIIHAAESHTHQRDSRTGQTACSLPPR